MNGKKKGIQMSMKILKVPVYWSQGDADCIYQFMLELKGEIWQTHGEEIRKMYEEIRREQIANEGKDEFDDEPNF